jgi:signal transduction histidine kinase
MVSIAVFCVLTALASAIAFYARPWFGIFTLSLCFTFLLVHLFFTRQRYKQMEALSFDIDRILHGEDVLSLESYAEGELGVLHSEIYKMTVRLREQRQRLQEDKTFLADFLADVSHQIRTPLTSLALITSLLREPDITNERREALLREYHVLLSRIDTLVTSLLKISKLDAGTVIFQQETVTLDELLQCATAPLLVPMELREQTLCLNAKGKVDCDMTWTTEAICNIVKNCMEHTPEGSMITVTALETALYTQIEVEDTGDGFAPKDIPHLFERFYKGSNASENSYGIGLALARTVITTQNGTVQAMNGKNGAKFVLKFYKQVI